MKNNVKGITKGFTFSGSMMLGLGLLQTACMNSGEVSEKPNIIIINADDLGYGDVGCYSATHVKTPNIDRLASQGRMFTDAHSASAVSTPSRYALLTGQYPFRKDIFSPVFDKAGALIDTTQLTIASLLKKSGYSTACIGKWHLGFGIDTPNWNGALIPGPLEYGFDYFFGIPTVSSHPPFVYIENHHVVGLDPEDPIVYGRPAETKAFQEKFGTEKMGGAKKAHALYDDEQVGTTLTARAVKWIREHKNEPFFLYYGTTNIHHPFTPDPRFNGTSQAGRYGDFIHELDWIVGEVMRTLDEENLSGNTLVIFTSDNGGMLNQGGQDAWKMGHHMNGTLLGFKFDAWEGGHRIPFIARWPGKIPPGSTSGQLISNVDMLGTFAALTGYQLREGEGPDSYNVLPAFIGQPKKQMRDDLIMAPLSRKHLALRKGQWVFITGQGGGGFSAKVPGAHAFGGPAAFPFTGEKNSDIENGEIKPGAPAEQLYNLQTDRSQSRNVIRDYPETADMMRELLNHYKTAGQTRPGK